MEIRKFELFIQTNYWYRKFCLFYRKFHELKFRFEHFTTKHLFDLNIFRPKSFGFEHFPAEKIDSNIFPPNVFSIRTFSAKSFFDSNIFPRKSFAPHLHEDRRRLAATNLRRFFANKENNKNKTFGLKNPNRKLARPNKC